MAKPMKDLIVVLPGIMGSVLSNDDGPIWQMSGGAAWKFLISGGGSLRDLDLPIDDPDVNDGVFASGLMQDLHVIPGLLAVDGYTGLTDMLTTYYRVEKLDGEPLNIVEFPYDWRRRLASTAAAFEEFIWQRLARWREHSPGAQLILVCHSMGGLVARYWAEQTWGRNTNQWGDVRALITFGTPHRGSLNALRFLTEGIRIPVFPDLTDMVRTLPGLYHLLPTFPSVQVDGAELTIPHTLAIPGLEPTLSADALAFHTELADLAAVHPDPWGKIHTFLGAEQKTRLWASSTQGIFTYYETPAPGASDFLNSGDGTVPQLSSMPTPGQWAAETAIAEQHGSLHINENNLVALRQRIDALQYGISAFTPEAAAVDDLRVRWEEWFPTGSDVTAFVGTGTDSPTDIHITVTSADDPAFLPLVLDVDVPAEGADITIGSLPDGRYRALIQSGIASDVHAVFGVA